MIERVLRSVSRRRDHESRNTDSATLKEATDDKSLKVFVREQVMGVISGLLQVEESEIDMQRPMMEMVLDSLASTQLVRELNEYLNVEFVGDDAF